MKIQPTFLTKFYGLLVLVLVLNTAAKPTHDFHSSLIHIEYTGGKYEVTLRLFSDDLELAVANFAKKKVHLDATESEAYITNYLSRTLKIKSSGAAHINWEWVGMETEPEATKIYLEYKAKDNANLTVVSTLFTELFDDQKNIITLERKGNKESQLLDKNTSSYTFNFKN
jgi:hypothetical protein